MKVKYLVLLCITGIISLLTGCIEIPETGEKKEESPWIVVEHNSLAKNSRLDINLVFNNAHYSGITHLAYTPDSRILVSASDDCTIRLWDVRGKRLLRTLCRNDAATSCIAISDDGKLVAAGDKAGTIQIWDILTNSLLLAFRHADAVGQKNDKYAYSVDFLPGSHDFYFNIKNAIYKFSPGDDFTPAISPPIYRYEDYPDKEKISSEIFNTYYRLGFFYIMAMTPDKSSIFVRNRSNNLVIDKIDAASGKTVKSFFGHQDAVNALAISPDGRLLLSGSNDKKTILWDVKEETILKTFEDHKADVTAAAVAPDTDTIATGDRSGRILITDPDSGSIVVDFSPQDAIEKSEELFYSYLYSYYTDTCIAHHPQGKYFATGRTDSKIRLYSAVSGAPLKEIEAPIPQEKYKALNCVMNLYFSLDGNIMVSRSYIDRIVVWDTRDWKILHIITESFAWGNISLFITKDNKYLYYSFDGNNYIRRFDLVTGVLEKIDIAHEPVNPRTFAESPDGKRLVMGTYTGRLLYFDSKTFNLIEEIRLGDTFKLANYLHNAQFNRNLDRIAVLCPSDNFSIIQLDNKQEIFSRRLDNFEISKIEWSPDGKRLFALPVRSFALNNTISGNTSFFFWDEERAPEGKIISPYNLLLTDIAFSPDSDFLYLTSIDGSIKILDLRENTYFTIITRNNREWAMFNAGGQFDCSPGMKTEIAFNVGLESYGHEQFWEYYYQPGIYQLFLAHTKLSENQSVLDSLAKSPLVLLSRTALDEAGGKITLKAQVQERGNGTGRISLYHNGRLIDESAGAAAVKVESNGKEYTLPLLAGSNNLYCVACDKANVFENKSNIISLDYLPPELVRPAMYILSAGVSKYKDENLRLESCVKDAESVSKVFRDISREVYAQGDTLLLSDQKANKQGIYQAFKQLKQKTQKKDIIVLFLSGHGEVVDDEYYFLPQDIDVADIGKTGIGMQELKSWINDLPANKIVLLLDTCKSGRAAEQMDVVAFARGYDEKKRIANLAREQGIVVFSASNASQAAFEMKSLGHGLFTYALLQTIADKQEMAKDGLITISEILGKTGNMTKALADRYLHIEQNPVIYMFGDDFVMGK